MKDEQNTNTHDNRSDNIKVTYGDLISKVRLQREAKLEDDYPGRKTNPHAILNTTRSLSAFLEIAGLTESDFVGPEILDQHSLEKLVEQFDCAPATARRRRSELNKHIRPTALAMVQAAEGIFNNETFGERLQRLRLQSGLSTLALCKAITPAGKKPNSLVYGWIDGSYIPSIEMSDSLKKIADLLEVDFSYLIETLPKNRSKSSTKYTKLPRSIQQKLVRHMPDNFEQLNADKKEEIIEWVSDNILSTPKEILDDESVNQGSLGPDIAFYVFSRDVDTRTPMSSESLISELDKIIHFKTAKLVPKGTKRNTSWSKVTANRADYHLRSFVGALHTLGFPADSSTVCSCLFPDIIDMFIEWKVSRRGGYTGNINDPLQIFESLLNPDTGFLYQSSEFSKNIRPVPGFISVEEALSVTSSENGSWEAACIKARAHLKSRIKEINKISEKGRDPFEAILPVLTTDNPVKAYISIINEIRVSMPDRRYTKRHAEALRLLMTIRIGVACGLRSKNLRELLFAYNTEERTWKQLKRLKRGELVFNEESCYIRIPREAFKNSTSKSVEDENTILIHNHDGLFNDIRDYLNLRHILLSDYEDPGTFFVKTANSNTKSIEYDLDGYYNLFRSAIENYGIYNPYTNKGAISGLRPHGPHSVRHIIATTMVKLTGGFSEGAALLMDTEETVRDNYARFLPGERHARAQDILLKSLGGE